MKNKILSVLSILFVLCTCMFIFTACEPSHTHSYESAWSYNETHHWHESTCDCEVTADFEEHTFEDSGWCTVCEQAILPTDGILYDVSADGTYAEVITYAGTSTKVNIASTYNGLPVRAIYSEAFANTAITTVIIPDSVTSIGRNAFYKCSSLTSITIPDGVTTIGDDAFSDCTALLYNTFGNIKYLGNENNPYVVAFSTESTNFTRYQLHEQTKILADGVFRNCSRLTRINIPDSVTSIGRYAFAYCSSLNIVIIGNSVRRIDSYAFYSCGSLTSITIPDRVTSIGDWAFTFCSSLTSVTIGDSVTTIGGDAFSACSSLTRVTCPASAISHIPQNKLQTVVITSGDAIGPYAFYYCDSLTSIEISNSVTTIGDWAFYYCTNLTSITIPDSVTIIGEKAFSSCTRLKSVVIGDGVKSIGAYAFGSCTNLKNIKYRGTQAQWSAISKGTNWDYNTGAYSITYNYTGD